MDVWFLFFLFAVALLFSVGASLLLVGYVGTVPASFAFGWRNWVPTLVFPVIGPMWFSLRHRRDFSLPGKQLIIGILMIVAALVLLYGAGPHFVDRLAAGVK